MCGGESACMEERVHVCTCGGESACVHVWRGDCRNNGT